MFQITTVLILSFDTLYNKIRDTICDRFLFILWSKSWRDILDPSEEKSVLLCPDMKKGIIKLVLELLMTGEASRLEQDPTGLLSPKSRC